MGIKYQKPTPENNSKPKPIEASGQLVTPQNSKTIPSAAPKGAGRPKSVAKKAPKVEPIKRVGTISPPLKPIATETQVKSNFKAKASGLKLIEAGSLSPPKILSITLMPAPL